jgi:hypothetical protein
MRVRAVVLLAVGLAVGGAVGWTLGARSREAATVRSGPESELASEGAPGPATLAAKPPDATTPAGAGSKFEVVREPVPGKDPIPLGYEETVPRSNPRDVLARAQRALADGDRSRFFSALRESATASDAALRGQLLAWLADTTLELPTGAASAFADALDGTRSPEVARSARVRFEQELASGNTSWTAAEGWLRMVVDHGDASDVAWVIALVKDGSSRIRDKAIEALTASTNEHARRWTRALLTQGPRSSEWERAWEGYAATSPDEAAALALELASTADAETRPVLWQAAAGAVRAEGLPVLRTRLTTLPLFDRVEAVEAVEVLHRRGLDVSGFESVWEAPTEFLETQARTMTADQATRATDAVEHSGHAGTERAATALESAARTPREAGASIPVGDMLAAAKKVRARLASRWK